MQKCLKHIPLVALLATAAACSKDPNAPDATTSLTGRWLTSDTVEVFTAFDVHLSQNAQGLISGNWVGKTRITNGQCDAIFTCAPANIVFGSNLSLGVELQILGAGLFNGQLVTKTEIEGQINRYGMLYKLRLHKID